MKQVTYLIVTFVVLFQLYATTSGAPPIQPPPPRNGMQPIDGLNDTDVHHVHHQPHVHGHEFAIRVYETPGNTLVFIKNLLQEASNFFHVDLSKGNTVVVLEEDQDESEGQIYTQRVLTLENQKRLQALNNTKDDRTAPKMITHLPESSSRETIRLSDEERNGTVRPGNGGRT